VATLTEEIDQLREENQRLQTQVDLVYHLRRENQGMQLRIEEQRIQVIESRNAAQ
jgi:hypothetical protein